MAKKIVHGAVCAHEADLGGCEELERCYGFAHKLVVEHR